MKFEFTEGQWIDGQKLSAWQKQWCLDNLKYASEGSFRQFKESVYDLIEFRYSWGSCGSQDCFGTVSHDDLESENEITFNDFYWDEEVSTQESIFDNPRWVTVKGKDGDTTSFFGYQLVCGKDYKVVSQSERGYDIQLTPTKVIEVSKEYFHKVTPEELLPTFCDCVIGSFDNLRFTQPSEKGASVPLKNLSEDQLLFICKYFNIDYPESDKTHFSCLTIGDKYFSKPIDKERPQYNLSFNNLFKEVIL